MLKGFDLNYLIREHLHMTSDDFGPFLTYLLTLIQGQLQIWMEHSTLISLDFDDTTKTVDLRLKLKKQHLKINIQLTLS